MLRSSESILAILEHSSIVISASVVFISKGTFERINIIRYQYVVFYLKNDPNVNLQDADYEEALNYIRQHMEAGVGLWTESSVIEQLKNWKLSLIPVVTQNQPSPHDNNTNNHEVNVVDSQSLTSKHTKAKERIKSLTMDEAREILDDLCDLRIDSVLNIILK